MKFSCGCEYEMLDFENINIPLDCPETWNYLATGLTKGVFQLEKSLGKKYTKEIKPRSVDELGAVISLIRPGCLMAEFREDEKNPGKFFSITDTYIKIKNGELKPEYISPALEPIFKDTYGVPVYQEQIMRICSEFAGFTLKEADDARKAVGKKLKDKMAQLEVKFVEGAKKQGHDEQTAKTIFGWIDKFSGYGFNKSHAVSYAMIGYLTGYAKTHFPLEFFKAMLTNSEGKQDSLEEIQELVNEAKLFNIEVRPPNLSLMTEDFAIQDEQTIAFGLAHVKGIGASSIGALKKIADVKSPREFLIAAYPEKPTGAKLTKKQKEALENIEEVEQDTPEAESLEKAVEKEKKKGKLNKTVCEALIKCAALDHINKNRVKLLECYRIMGELTDKERRTFISEHYKKDTKFDDALKEFLARPKGGPSVARKPKILEAMANIRSEFLGANPKKLAIAWEKFYLGVPLSGSLVELYSNPRVDAKLRNLLRLRPGNYNLGVVIEGVKKFKDKNGNWMAFLTLSDETYMMDTAVVFAKAYQQNGWIIEEGKPVLINGRKEKDSFFVNRIEHL